MHHRESFSSRLGFILISAGCAIGLGNVWRFPYIVGQYGGGAFVLVYLFFLLILGLPVMVMEFAVGRASRKSVALSFRVLEPKGTKWHLFGYAAMAGNYLLMMFYTTIAGWIVSYLFRMASGSFEGLSTEAVAGMFDSLTGNSGESMFWMALVTIAGFSICALGLQKGVEKVTKAMMVSLLFIILVLDVKALTLPNAMEGLRFYLKPDFAAMWENGLWSVIFAAMGQAFFTLSVGIGSMAIFGSYLKRDKRLLGESASITVIDTVVALLAGLIIFPACAAFGIHPGSGPSLIFVTLPNIFNSMAGGQFWGSLFFIFMSFAALSTVIAVFENIVSFATDLFGWSKKKASFINIFVVFLLSLPCTLGFSLFSGVTPLGAGSTILDLEDFIVSNNLLPLGALVYLMFCVSRHGWGWDSFLREANTGNGIRFPAKSLFYFKYILPIIFFIIFLQGYLEKFVK